MAFKLENTEDGLVATCDICKASLLKTKQGDWVAYLTLERTNKYFQNYLAGVKEECWHTDSEINSSLKEQYGLEKTTKIP